ncbi:hypothetical protein LINPERHAP2_LOCUS25657 [Linum perenne]
MDLWAELLVYHGGRMKIALGSDEYQGGQVAEIDVMDDYVCFFQLKKIGTEILGYDSVERMWYVPPGGTLGTDLREINNDADAEKVRSVAKGGVVSLYMKATGDPSVVADNEDAVPGNEHEYATSDTETRKVRATYQADGGIEVDQLNEGAVTGVQQEEVLIDVEDPVEMDFMNMQSMEY